MSLILKVSHTPAPGFRSLSFGASCEDRELFQPLAQWGDTLRFGRARGAETRPSNGCEQKQTQHWKKQTNKQTKKDKRTPTEWSQLSHSLSLGPLLGDGRECSSCPRLRDVAGDFQHESNVLAFIKRSLHHVACLLSLRLPSSTATT